MAKKPLGGFGMLGAFSPSGSGVSKPGIGPKTGNSIVNDIRRGNSPISNSLGIRSARGGSNKKKKK